MSLRNNHKLTTSTQFCLLLPLILPAWKQKYSKHRKYQIIKLNEIHLQLLHIWKCRIPSCWGNGRKLANFGLKFKRIVISTPEDSFLRNRCTIHFRTFIFNTKLFPIAPGYGKTNVVYFDYVYHYNVSIKLPYAFAKFKQIFENW